MGKIIKESNKMLKISSVSEATITLDIRGSLVKTRVASLRTIPDSLLANIDQTSSFYDKSTNSYYFDRDPLSFRHILNAYNDGELHISTEICPEQFKKELEFWKIPIKLLAPCCWKPFYDTQNEMEVYHALMKRLQRTPVHTNKVTDIGKAGECMVTDIDVTEDIGLETGSTKSVQHAEKIKKDRQTPNKLWLFLDEPLSSLAAKVWLFIYLGVVLISVVVVFVWVEPSCRVDLYLDTYYKDPDYSFFDIPPIWMEMIADRYETTEKVLLMAMTDPHPALFTVDILCTAFFTLETIVHFCACPAKLNYIKDLYNILKIVLCAAMIITKSLDLNKHVLTEQFVGNFYLFICSISVMRLLLIFRLRKLYRNLDIMLLSLASSCRELMLLGFGFLICVVMYGTVMFSVEMDTETFANIGEAMWWAVITMTTVGYGDFFPTTAFGYIVGVVCSINGLIVLALPVAAIASNFAAFYSKNKDLEKHEKALAEEENHNKGSNCPVKCVTKDTKPMAWSSG